VDKHFLTVKPGIITGKVIFVAWLVDRNFFVAHEMASLAAKYNVKTIIGIQCSFSPIVQYVKSRKLVEEGTTGKLRVPPLWRV
jgi:predicted dehydrogenase